MESPRRTRPPFAVWAIGLPHGYILMEHRAQAIDVTDEDVARGFVDVRGGSRIVVTTRAGGRYALDFATRKHVQLEALRPESPFVARSENQSPSRSGL